MKITDELIDYIAELSRLELGAEEREGAKSDLTDILNYMDKLNEVDTTGMTEMSHPFREANRFREDEVTNSDNREELMKIAPDKKDSYFKVLKALE